MSQRLSQTPLEILADINPNVRNSQQVVEILAKINPHVRNSQQVVEVLGFDTPGAANFYMAQMGLEILSDVIQAEVGSGGVLISGIVSFVSSSNIVGLGGTIVGGFATIPEFGRGGLTVAGTANLWVQEVPKGGILVGGISIYESFYRGSGGVLISGHAAEVMNLSTSGGVLINGLSPPLKIINLGGSAGVIIGGTIVSSFGMISTGGAIVAGTGIITHSDQIQSSGGILVGGSNTLNFYYFSTIQASGAVIAPVAEYGVIYEAVITQNNGTIVSGEASPIRLVSRNLTQTECNPKYPCYVEPIDPRKKYDNIKDYSKCFGMLKLKSGFVPAATVCLLPKKIKELRSQQRNIYESKNGEVVNLEDINFLDK